MASIKYYEVLQRSLKIKQSKHRGEEGPSKKCHLGWSGWVVVPKILLKRGDNPEKVGG